MFGPLPITDVMDETVETASPETGALEAARTLHERAVGLVVVVEDGTVVGVFTESDAVGLLVDGGDPATVRLSEVMSSPVLTIDVGATVVDAAEQMRDNRVRRLPVLDGGTLVGVVTTADVSNYVPGVRNWRSDERVDSDRTRQTTREDTAYERDGWEFEYVGHEAQIDVGDIVRFSKPLDEAEVEEFADASGDTNRLHLDDAYAEGTRFGRRIVHGTLVSGVISAALARLPGLIIYLSQELSYLGPVDVGERVTAECEVVEDLGGDRYRLDTRVAGADGDPVVDGGAVVLADPIPETA